MIFFIILIVLAIVLVSTCVKIVPQAHSFVIERLGVYKETWSVGLHFKIPFLDRVSRKVNLKEQVADFEAVLTLKSLEAFAAAADGQATKIIIPSEIQGIAGSVKALAEVIKD